VAEVVARAGGSPLFAEELARLAAAGRESRAAPTIEAAIQVSLDALSPECRDAVGRLSVLGLTTWDSALTALGLPNAAELMRELAAFEILLEQDNSRFPSAREFVFKHALIRDVAYAALDADNHRELHALAGEWLARMGGDAATVAGHLDAGGRPELACVHWLRAAERALATHALGDALSMAERALAYAEPGPAGFQSARILDEAWSRLDPRAADRETAITALDDFAYDEPSRVVADGARARYDDARGRGGDIDRRLAETLTAAASLGMGEELARCSATLAARAAFAGDFEVAEAEAQRLLELANRELPSARVDAYQTLAVIRQAKGAVSTALEARKSAAGAAREAGLKERESMLTTNLGFALSTIGARQEAREALEKGLLLAEAVGSAGAARHAQMNLLGWSALYGTDRQLDGYLAEARAEADAAATGLWAAPDRSNLGVLFYRGVELLLGSAPARVRALSLLRMAVESYRSLGHRDVLPGALAAWAEGLRLDGSPGEAAEVAGEAAELLEQGAPSLLNEAPVFLTLYKAQLDLGDEGAATLAIQRGLPFLSRRLQGLLGSPYARGFLTDLPYNAELVSAADRQGLLPEAVRGAFARSTN
ncbi:MAG TPA: serine/threonine-protein kinase PknK, partial [Polyangiaceae bacterium]|nr:serine/threonine-protein kinase PknK [Polyangiaceae bacterium]